MSIHDAKMKIARYNLLYADSWQANMLYLQTLLHDAHLQPTKSSDLLLMLYSACGILHTLPEPGTIGQCDHTGLDQDSLPARDSHDSSAASPMLRRVSTATLVCYCCVILLLPVTNC